MFKIISLIIFLISTSSFSLNKYKMDLNINFEDKKITGISEIKFTNIYNFPIKSLYFNLYQNGFQEKSTLFKEGEFLKKYIKKFGDEAFSYTKILKLLINDKECNFNFICSDDGNENDKTLIEVQLPQEINFGEEILIKIYWETKLHKFYFRSGYSKDSLYLMQWYPKLCVFEGERWKAYQFHAFTEFYGDFLDFEINLKIPKDWEVASTGRIEEKQINGEKEINIFAENVHDVAIVISRELKKHKRKIEVEPNFTIDVEIFLPSEYTYKIPGIIKILKECIYFYNEWIGPYLYQNFTIVFPTYEISKGSAGMEYPQLILCGIKHSLKKEDTELAYAIAHEFAHQYFYGIIASNEIDEPYLDEGFTTYISSKFIEKKYRFYYPEIPFLIRIFSLNPSPINPFYAFNIFYYEDDGSAYFNFPGWQHPDYKQYRIYSYNKPAMALKTLENIFGEENIKKFLRDWFETFSFLHPKTEDLIKIIEKNFGRIWAQNFFILSSKPQLIDYKVKIISDKKIVLKKQGDLLIPVNFLVFYKDKTKENLVWEGNRSFQIFEFEKEIEKVILDPEDKIMLDVDPTNNIDFKVEKKKNIFSFFFHKISIFLESIICWF